MEAVEVPALIEEAELGEYEFPDRLLEGKPASEDTIDLGEQLGDPLLADVMEQFVAVLEVQIQRPLGDTGLVGDVLHGGRRPLAGDGAKRALGDRLDAEPLEDSFSGF